MSQASEGPRDNIVGARADGREVVCTLPATSLGERAAWVERDILPHVSGRRRVADGFQLDFAKDAGIRQKLEHWAELERGCCTEARFEITEDATGLQLTVHGIDPASSALAEMLGAAPAASQGANRVARLASAGGVGALGAFLLLCVLPMAVVAVAGASVAAPLARLESPPVLGVGALVIGGGWWLWRRRGGLERERGGDVDQSGCGC